MAYIEQEKLLENYPLPVTIDETILILNQLKKCICKIENKNGKGTGFFCYIPYKNKKLEVMITNNHIIDEEILKTNEMIKISLNDDKEIKNIKIKNRKIYTSKKYDTTIIEINSEIDKIYDYLELDNKIFNENINICNRSIYILQYPKALNIQKAAISYGIMKNIEEYNINHYCCTEHGSSGSPILQLSNKKIIGIHKDTKYNYNRGTYLKFPINEYLNLFYGKKNNIISMKIIIDKEDINKNIYFLDNTDSLYFENGNWVEHHHDNLKELNELNTELFINNMKYKYKKYFKPIEEGLYDIKLKFKSNFKNCSYMFSDCSKITDIDFSSYDTKNIINMSHMFYKCSNLTNIDLSSFDTKNVTSLSYMFSRCYNLPNIDLSSFDTKNVTNMSCMFSYCIKIENIDLSSFNTKNVTDMFGMFGECFNLPNINLSSFDTKNVINMRLMFNKCSNLTNIDLSSFNTKNVKIISSMFNKCSNIKFVKISNIDSNINLKKEILNYNNIKIQYNNVEYDETQLISEKLNNYYF